MDKFETIQAFVQVVKSRGFAAAAREMGRSRSQINKLVIHLENQLGVQLLHRSTRKVSPTATGLAFYEKCLDILSDLESAERALLQLHEEPKGIFKINAPMTFGTMYLTAIIAEFSQKYPELQLQLTLEDRFVDPIAEGYDLLVRIAKPTESANLIVHPLAETQLMICAAPSYLEKYGIPQHPNALRDHDCLQYGYLTSRHHWLLSGDDGEHTIPVQGRFCCNNGEALAIAAVNGLGIALLPEFIVSHYLRSRQLQVILPDYCPASITICVIYPLNRHLSTKIRLFTEFLQTRLRQMDIFT